MSERIAVEKESRVSKLLTTIRQDFLFYFRTYRLKFSRRLSFQADRLQTENVRGGDIVNFQDRFNHFAARFGIKIAVNGVYDAATRYAVADFQRMAMYVLDADGFVGPQTADVLHIKLLGDR